MTWIANICHLLIVATFGVSALSKVSSNDAFTSIRRAVVDVGRVPSAVALPAAAGLVALELGLAVATAIPATTGAALVLAIVVLAGFSGLIAVTIRSRPGTSCACFGPSTAPLGLRHIVRNALLVAVALVALAFREPHAASPANSVAGWIICAATSIAVAAIIAFWDDVTELIAPA